MCVENFLCRCCGSLLEENSDGSRRRKVAGVMRREDETEANCSTATRENLPNKKEPVETD